MKKIIFIGSIILILVLSLGINYLNRVYLPIKIKALIIKGIEDATQKKASLGSLKFNIFKGLVLRDLSVYGQTGQILNIKEASCAFLTPFFFKKDKGYSGNINISNVALKLGKVDVAIEDVNGRVQLSPDKLSWQDLNFKYLGLEYRTSGELANFQAPAGELKLSSQDLTLESGFSVSGKQIRFSKFSGRYLNSKFSLTADADFSSAGCLNTLASGELDISLGDLSQLGQIKPQGLLRAKFNLDGDIYAPKMCAIKAEVTGERLSAYGLKFADFSLNYAQEAGRADISPIRLSLYEGTIEAAAKMDLVPADLPYRINAGIRGVKIERLKLDTPAKDNDIAGVIQAEADFSGFSSDSSKLTGSGKVLISDGKLWELNLFKGLGALLFTSDFSKVVFSEGSCTFRVADKIIYTDDLKLKSNLVDIAGEAKIGFDGSIDASLNAELLEEAPLTGTIKDVTTAILGTAGKFGVIKLSGTLKEPKYKFKPVVIDILKGLKDSLLKK